MLLAGAIIGAIFAHSSATLEVLGTVSSVLRDLRFVQLPPGADKIDGMNLTLALKYEQIRLGVVETRPDGGQVLGVSWKDSVEQVRRK
jgi:hypothetical protein